MRCPKGPSTPLSADAGGMRDLQVTKRAAEPREAAPRAAKTWPLLLVVRGGVAVQSRKMVVEEPNGAPPGGLVQPERPVYVRPAAAIAGMDPQEALRQADAHLKNALELVGRPVGKEELMYMWDNQITALDNFLADTEAVVDAKVKEARAQLRDAKKKLTDAVVAFEAQQAGEDVGKEELAKDEQILSYVEMAGDMVQLAKEALAEKVADVKDLVKWEEPLAVINGYLADSEAYQEASKDLRRARSMVRLARKDLKNRIDDVFTQWRKADLSGGRDDEDDV